MCWKTFHKKLFSERYYSVENSKIILLAAEKIVKTIFWLENKFLCLCRTTSHSNTFLLVHTHKLLSCIHWHMLKTLHHSNIFLQACAQHGGAFSNPIEFFCFEKKSILENRPQGCMPPRRRTRPNGWRNVGCARWSNWMNELLWACMFLWEITLEDQTWKKCAKCIWFLKTILIFNVLRFWFGLLKSKLERVEQCYKTTYKWCSTRSTWRSYWSLGGLWYVLKRLKYLWTGKSKWRREMRCSKNG